MRYLSLLVFTILAYQNCSDVDLVHTQEQPTIEDVAGYKAYEKIATYLDDQHFAVSGNTLATCRNGRVSIYYLDTQALIDHEATTDNCIAISIHQDWIATSTSSNLNLFKIESNTIILKQTITKPSFSNSLSAFGLSISLSADTLVVGDINHSIATNGREGAALIYKKVDDTWSFQQQVFAGDPGNTELFGHRVFVEGDNLFISARYDNLKGAVYVFKNTAGTWAEVQKISSPESLDEQQFGFSFSVDSNYLAVGAVAFVSSPIELSKGSVYIYKKTSNWEYQDKITAVNPQIEDFFGFQVALKYPSLAVAAPQQFGASMTGFVNMYQVEKGEWTFKQKLEEANTNSYGRDLKLIDSYLIVKANNNTGENPFFMYQRSAN